MANVIIVGMNKSSAELETYLNSAEAEFEKAYVAVIDAKCALNSAGLTSTTGWFDLTGIESQLLAAYKLVGDMKNCLYSNLTE